MLKKFFITMLGSMAALWLSLLFFVILAICGLGVIIGKSMSSTPAPSYERGILCLNLQGDIPEREGDQSIQDILMGGLSESENFTDIVTAIRLASDDKKIEGIYMDCKGSAMGLAARSEVVEALKDFKKTGKFVYAYADNFDQGDYYMASVADSIFLNPVGSINVHGLATTIIFYKGLLDKLGVQVQVVKVGAYKSAVEPFILTGMSEPSREQTNVFLSQIWDGMKEEIALSRGIEPAQVDMWADSLSFTWAPQRYLQQDMVTSLKYRTQVNKMLRDKVGLDDEDELPFLTPAEYVSLKSDKLGKADKGHIAVLYAVGDITEAGEEGIASERLVPEIEELMRNDDVKGVVMRVNSPGGSAFASEQIWHALQQLKAEKPLYVSMGDYAASGGYYISCGADKIFADAATLTGSIGIFGLIPDAQGLLHDKLGLNFATVETNPDANFPNLYQPMTPNQKAGMQGYVERGYETFVSRVASGRELSVDSVKAIGGGRVWDGTSALRLGLVDELGSLHSAVQAMAADLGMKANNYVCYPLAPKKWYEKLIDQSISMEVKIEGIDAKDVKRCLDAINEIKNLDPLQARMETMIMQ